MSGIPQSETVDQLTGEFEVPLNIPDLDRSFRLKIRSMVALSTPLMYGQFSRSVDVAALRRAGFGSVVTYAEFERAGGPLPVAAPMTIRVELRHCELSGWGLGQRASRLGFECRYTFLAAAGSGDPLRYRDVVPGAEPAVCGRGRLLLTLVRPFAPPAGRLVTQPLEQTRGMAVQVLKPPHPSMADLSAVPPGYTEAAVPGADAGRAGVFGLHHTDTNQYVYTGVYLDLLEDHLTWLLGGADLPVAEHSVERVAVAFKSPFQAGDPYAARGRLWRADDRTLGQVGVYAGGTGAADDRAAVFGRLEGRVSPERVASAA